jgi:general secretion pathway protein C
MELYLKRYFWVIPVVVVIVCAVLLATAVNHLIEGKYLLGGEEHKASTAPKPHKPTAKPATVSKDSKPIVQRNLFCSDPACDPPTDQPVVATGPQPTDPNNPPATSLPLALVATAVAGDPVFSSATVINTQSTKAGSYWLGEEIPDAGRIVNIEPRWVDFENKNQGNRVERIDILGAVPQAQAPAATPAAKPAATGAEGDFVAAVDKGVKKVDDTHYEIDRSLVDMVLGDPNLVARGARIVPSIKDGKANGFKVYAIRPNSAFAKIGLQNGDTLHSVNGFEMTSPDKALEVYTKVKSANNLTVSMTRRGQPLTMEYSIK